MPRNRKQVRRPDVPPQDHVARHCNPQRVIRDPKTDKITGTHPAAFALRDKEGEPYLSLYWMEFFHQGVPEQFRSVVAALRRKRTVRPRSAIARLSVQAILDAACERGQVLRLKDRSHRDSPGYVGLEGLPLDNSDMELLALFATQCCNDVKGVAEIDAMTPLPTAPSTTT